MPKKARRKMAKVVKVCIFKADMQTLIFLSFSQAEFWLKIQSCSKIERRTLLLSGHI